MAGDRTAVGGTIDAGPVGAGTVGGGCVVGVTVSGAVPVQSWNGLMVLARGAAETLLLLVLMFGVCVCLYV